VIASMVDFWIGWGVGVGTCLLVFIWHALQDL
jgi:hypothetical protein